MNKNSVAVAEAYYTAMKEKNIADLEKYLHPHVKFMGPLAETEGKEAVVDAAKKFSALFKSLTIRAKFGAGDQAVVVFDVELPAPIGKLPSVAFLTIKDGLITKNELFFDARPFSQK
jgi:hypothetical protein